MNDRAELGAMLRQARRRARMTLRAVAEAMGTTPEYIAQVESGTANPPLLTCHALARAVGARFECEIAPPAAKALADAGAQQTGKASLQLS